MGRRRYITHSFSVPFVGTEKLYIELSSLFHQVQTPALQKPHLRTLILHLKIGKLLVEYQQRRVTTDENHQALLSQLSERLLKKFGNKFSLIIFEESYKFYLIYPPFSKKNPPADLTDTPQFQNPLTWEQYRLLIHVDCPQARNFYEKEASNSNWSPSLLEHFIKGRLFERLSSGPHKESILRFVQQKSLELFSKNNNKLNKFIDT